MTALPSDGCHALPISRLFRLLAEHLGTLTERIGKLENAAGRYGDPEQAIGHDTIKSLQDLDYLKQSLEDLTNLAGILSEQNIAASLSEAQCEEYAQQLRMVQTKSLLCSNRPSPKAADLPEPGEPLLF